MFLPDRNDALLAAKKGLVIYGKFRSGIAVDFAVIIQLLTEADKLLEGFVADDRLSLTEGLGSFKNTELAQVVNSIIHLTDLSQLAPQDDQFKKDHRILADLLNVYHGSEIDPVRADFREAFKELYPEQPFAATLLERELRGLILQLADALETSIQASLVRRALNVMLGLNKSDLILSEATLLDLKAARRANELITYLRTLRTLGGQMYSFDAPFNI